MKVKKWTALTVSSVITATLLAGCGVANDDGGSSAATPGKTNEVASNINKSGMPIAKEQIELTFFTGLAATNGSNKFEERLVWSEYAKQSNIKVNFQTVPFESLTEKRNLALANGDYPDVLYSARVPAADLMKYGSQGVFVKLNDLINDYAPNLKKLMDKYPDLRKALTMPDGNIYSMPTYYSPEFLPMLIGTPLWVKQDWLDKLNLKEPKTTDELYAYFKAVKHTDLNGNGQADEIPYSGTGINPLLEQIMGAWGLGTRGLGHKYVDMDPKSNQLRFYRTTNNMKELLQYTNKLY